MLRASALFVGLSVGVTATAFADNKSFDIDHLQLALTRSTFFATEGAEAPPRWDWRAAIAYHYIQSPLVLVLDNGKRSEVVSSRSTLDFQGAVQFGKWVGLGIALPVVVDDHGSIDVPHGAALGDLRLVPRVEILHKGRFHLAGLLDLRLPTGKQDRVVGDGMVVFEPRIAFQVKLGMVDLGTNFGVRIREQRSFYDLTVGNETFLTLAASVTPKPWISAVVEVHGDTAMNHRFAQSQSSPLEILLGVFGQWRWLRGGVAAGFGAVEGFGAPRARVLATLEMRRWNKPRPALPSVVVEPPPEAEQDEASPEVPHAALPEPKLVPVPELDTAEVTKEEPAVAVHKGHIELADPIYFDTDRKRIHHKYWPELEQLARVLRRRTELTTIWIEGHADQAGPERWNLELSRARAESVAQFLATHGVERARLRPVGFGEAHPLVPAKQGESNEKNRRVHFFTDSADRNEIRTPGPVPTAPTRFVPPTAEPEPDPEPIPEPPPHVQTMEDIVFPKPAPTEAEQK